MSIETKAYVEKKYTPTFTEGEIVILTRDCYSYSTIADFDGLYFKEGRVCQIKKCGLAHFFVNKKGEKGELVMDGEWCSLDAILEESEIIEPEQDFDNDDCLIGGLIHVNDLREAVEEDFQ